MPGKRSTLAERFWSKVDVDPDGCWLWNASLSDKGYGKIGLGGRGRGHVPAHRVSWELANGPIPDGLWVLHRCDVRRCVRPDHLFLGTVTDNQLDMARKERWKNQHPTRLTAELVREIKKRRRSGERRVDLAREYGVTEGTIGRIMRGKVWSHVN